MQPLSTIPVQVPNQEADPAWYAVAVQVQNSLDGIVTLYAATPISHVLPWIPCAHSFCQALPDVRIKRHHPDLSHFNPIEYSRQIGKELQALTQSFEQGNLAPIVHRIEAGQLFLAAIKQAEEALGALHHLEEGEAGAAASAPVPVLSLAPARRFTFRLEVKKEDFWIGGYWKQAEDGLHIWICLLPCLPLHLHFVRSPHACGERGRR